MTSVRHIGVVVSDLDRALEFYRGLLGLNVVQVMDEAGDFLESIIGIHNARVRTVKLAGLDNGCQVELLAFAAPSVGESSRSAGLTTSGLTHIALNVDDLEGLYQRMIDSGVHFTTRPMISPDKRAKVTFCRDPDGTFVELVEPILLSS